jgi:hypothetical protein
MPNGARHNAKPQHYRPSALDRSWADSRILAVIGPIHGFQKAAVEAVVRSIQESKATPRIAIEPLAHERQWPYLDGSTAWSITARTGTVDLAQWLTEIGQRPDTRSPTEVFLCDDYLAVEYPHAVGDGHYGLNLVAALTNSSASTLAPDLPRHVVWRALWDHFGSHPQRLVQSYGLRKSQRRNSIPPLRPNDTTASWRATRRVAVGHIDHVRFAELQDWVAEHAPGSTRVAVMSALWLAALRAQQVLVDDHVVVLINCRRYLRPEQRMGLGNFAVGVPLRIASLEPTAITSLLRTVTDSGWPLAVIAMGEMRSRLRRRAPRTRNHSAAMPDRLRLSVSDMGRLPFDHLPWVGGRPRQATALLDLDEPDAMTLLLSELDSERSMSVTYCTEMVPQAKIDAAMEQMSSDPVGLLA